jgi:sphingolipid delta-4 desaturase
MIAPHTDFIQSADLDEPHVNRTKEILKTHPEIRDLIGRNPWSFALIVGIVSLQFVMAYVLREQAWWVIVIAAYLIGAFANHALFVLIHDACHKLIFKGTVANRLSAIIADLPGVIPSAATFSVYHLKHHSFQGDYTQDADLPSKFEAKLIGNTPWGKTVWMFLHPLFYGLRPLRLKQIQPFSLWTLINVATVVAVDVAVFYFFGWKSFLYLALAPLFGLGLHPLGARWIQEHFVFNSPQETYSYYGPLNIPALNVGYHNEHHDFPSIPWNRLPQVKALAPEWYDTLYSHQSWPGLMAKFLTDPKIDLFSRVERPSKVA